MISSTIFVASPLPYNKPFLVHCYKKEGKMAETEELIINSLLTMAKGKAKVIKKLFPYPYQLEDIAICREAGF